MAEGKITVRAQIEAVESAVEKQKIVRDRDAEERVRKELREKLQAEGQYEKMPSEEFHRLYQKQLCSYARYIGGRYTQGDEEDGKPGILVTKCLWENELRISYSVDGKNHRQTVTYDTQTDCLKKGDDFFVTVLKEDPKVILRQSSKDYRTKSEQKEETSSDDLGCFGWVILLLVIAFIYSVTSGGMG